MMTAHTSHDSPVSHDYPESPWWQHTVMTVAHPHDPEPWQQQPPEEIVANRRATAA